METRNSDVAHSIRATLEYEDAVNLLKLKKDIRKHLDTINTQLRVIRRVSRRAVTLARQDLENSAPQSETRKPGIGVTSGSYEKTR